VNTSNEHNVQIWLDTAECSNHASAPRAGARPALPSSARWNVAVLVGSGFASSVFFVAALLTDSLSYADPARVANPLSVQTSKVLASYSQVVDDVPTPQSVASIVARKRHTTPKNDRPVGPAKPAQSRIARLFLGDGTLDVQPFPRLPER
jgi:hypothetical protein